MAQQYVTVPISRDNKHETFTVNARYRIIRKVGSGAYGTVCSAFDQQYQQFCAIKKMHRVFDKKLVTKRCLREMKLLRLFNNHPRIIQLFDMDMIPGLEEIYLVFGCMDASLHDVIHSQQPLDTVHGQWFLYQLLSGLNYIHSANVIHRDLKPANILVNKDCDIRICDFGMARAFDQADTKSYLTEYVTTRWYRAPEIMVSNHNYSKAIDIWSVGCILGEILGRKVLFQGRDHVDQLYKILGTLGLPNDISFWDPSEAVSAHLKSLCTTDGLPPPTEPVDFNALFPTATEESLDLLRQLLCLDPAKRLTVKEALKHPFVQPFSDPAEESLTPPAVLPYEYYSFENNNSDQDLKSMIIHELKSFRYQLEQQEANYLHTEEGTCTTPTKIKRSYTTAVDSPIHSFASPTQKLDYLPSATMSLLEQHSPTTVQSKQSIMYDPNQLVGEPEELGENENYFYHNAPMPAGVSMDANRQFREPDKREDRDVLERVLSEHW
ncbi:kinase-like domain-containing protein [Gilbertella persicaria]|uniref:kinase-like domain-containing protein n=1 Tax=Gilbertella persicaria TaxID=101096 RepID=UPI00221F3DD2|nr:kinase-like domain-containing protein [Gilbertella persicaria]KAI8065404.1 kinase-like domain-containing protein [Gilbertella persicaria]